MIEVQQISKRYGPQWALHEVSFEIERGKVVGFLGPNGAGKSTMMKIITGYLGATSGQVLIDGKAMHPQNLELKRLIGYLPEHNPLYTDLYVREYLEHIARIYKLPNLRSAIDRSIESVGLEREQHKKIGQLSKGYRQRVGIAQALIHEPEILIFDEPTSGLDPNQIVEIRDLLARLGQQKTVMLSTHIMQEVQALCHELIIINQGKLVAGGSVNELHKLSSGTQAQTQVEFDEPVGEQFFAKISGIEKLEVSADGTLWTLHTQANNDPRRQLFEQAVAQGRVIMSLSRPQQKLEEVFRKLTQ